MTLSGESMRAIIMESIGRAAGFSKSTRIRVPAPAPGQVLVKVRAASVNAGRPAFAQRPSDHPQADAAYSRRRPGGRD